MYVVKEDTALTIPIFAHDANGDAITGLLTGDWTKRISKASGSFGALTATITEMEGGFYQLILTSSHTDTAGLLTIYLTHASCEQVNIQFRIEPRLLADLAYPSTSGRAMDVNADGTVDPSFDTASGTLDKTQTTGFNDTSDTSVAAAVWNAMKASYVSVGSFGEEVQAHALTTEIPTIGSITTAVTVAVLDGAMSSHVSAGTMGLNLAQMSLVDASVSSRSDFDVTSDGVIVTTSNDKTGYALTSAGYAAILVQTVEGVYTLQDVLKLLVAALAAKTAGGGTTTLSARDLTDTLNRIVLTVDANGNRSAATYNLG